MAFRRKISAGLTRRQWGTLLAVAPLVAEASAQVPAPGLPAQSSAKANADLQQTRQRLTEIILPMSVEPSFRFIA